MSKECWIYRVSFNFYLQFLGQNVTCLGQLSREVVGLLAAKVLRHWMWARLHVVRIMILEDKWKAPPSFKNFPQTLSQWECLVGKRENKTLKSFYHCPTILVRCQVRSRDRHRIKMLSLKWAVANTVHWLGSKKLN